MNRIGLKVLYELQRIIEKQFPPDDGVLVFHDIVDSENGKKDDYSMTSSEFYKFVQGLENAKVPIRRIGDESKGVCFTFDDGYKTAFTKAAPILKEYGIPFTIFLTCSFIDKEGYLSKSDIEELGNCYDVTFGSHCFYHKQLVNCSQVELYKEIVESKTTLEKLLEKDINYLAYPYGSMTEVDRKSIRLARKSGYKKSFSTVSCSSKILRNKWFYPRITVSSNNYAGILIQLSNTDFGN